MKNFQSGSVNMWLLIIIIVLVMVVGYFGFIKKPVSTTQEINIPSRVEDQNTQPVSTTPLSSTSDISVTQAVPVSSSPSIKVLSPNGGEVYSKGTNIQVKWSVADSNDIVRLLLVPGDIHITSFAYASANFTSPYSWTIPANVIAGSYKIKADIYDQSGSVPTLKGSDMSDNYFTITAQ